MTHRNEELEHLHDSTEEKKQSSFCSDPRRGMRAGLNVTLRVFPGVAFPGSLCLGGVRLTVPYSMSSSVCRLFFRCCQMTRSLEHTAPYAALHVQFKVNPSFYPFQFLPLLLCAMAFPVRLHKLLEIVAPYQELLTLSVLPSINLHLQLFLKLNSKGQKHPVTTDHSQSHRVRQSLAWQLTFVRPLRRSALSFSSFRRFPPLLLNLDGSVAFFCVK